MAAPNPALEAYLDGLREKFNKASDGYKQKYVRETFETFDVDGGGTIDPDEFRQLCRRISPTMTDEDVAEALEVIDEDGDGEITFAEFEVWWNGDYASELREAHEAMMGSSEMDEVEMVERWEGKKRDLEEAKLRRTFDGVDDDGSGEIEWPEFKRLCRRLDARLADELVEAAWKQLDEDGSGAADFREFESWWSSPGGRELRGVTDEECPQWSYKELLAAVNARVAARAEQKAAEKAARAERLAADKAVRAERRAAKAAAREAARAKAEEEAAEAARKAEEERMQSKEYRDMLEQRAADEERRERLLAPDGQKKNSRTHTPEVLRRDGRQRTAQQEREDMERKWKEQMSYQMQRSHSKLPPVVNASGARSGGMSLDTPTGSQLGISTVDPYSYGADMGTWLTGNKGRGGKGDSSRKNKRDAERRERRLERERRRSKRASGKLRFSTTADTITSAATLEGTVNLAGAADGISGNAGNGTSGSHHQVRFNESSGQFADNLDELGQTVSDLCIGNKDKSKDQILSQPAVGQVKASLSQLKGGKPPSKWLGGPVSASGRLSAVRAMAQAQLAIEIAADERERRIAQRLSRQTQPHTGKVPLGKVATRYLQPVGAGGAQEQPSDTNGGGGGGGGGSRIRKRHDHPGRERYPLVGAILRA